MKNSEQLTPAAAAVTALSTLLCCVPTTFAAAVATTSVGLFVADHQGQPTLWVRTLDSAEARPLSGTARARWPFWSPDNRSIGFFADGHRRAESRRDHYAAH